MTLTDFYVARADEAFWTLVQRFNWIAWGSVALVVVVIAVQTWRVRHGDR